MNHEPTATPLFIKSIEKYKERLEEKIHKVLGMIEEGIAQDNNPEDDPPTPFNSEEIRKRCCSD